MKAVKEKKQEAKNPRTGWEESFKAMAQAEDDKLLDPEVLDHTFDKDEWVWE